MRKCGKAQKVYFFPVLLLILAEVLIPNEKAVFNKPRKNRFYTRFQETCGVFSSFKFDFYGLFRVPGPTTTKLVFGPLHEMSSMIYSTVSEERDTSARSQVQATTLHKSDNFVQLKRNVAKQWTKSL